MFSSRRPSLLLSPQCRRHSSIPQSSCILAAGTWRRRRGGGGIPVCYAAAAINYSFCFYRCPSPITRMPLTSNNNNNNNNNKHAEGGIPSVVGGGDGGGSRLGQQQQRSSHSTSADEGEGGYQERPHPHRRRRPSSSSSISASTTTARKARRDYRNAFTAFFFKELDKGFASPYCIIVFGVVLSLAFYKVLYTWLEPRRDRLRHLTPRSKIPMALSHETMWGLTAPGGRRGGEGQDGGEMECARPGAAIFDPAVAVAESEALLARPRLIFSEHRTTTTSSSVDPPSGGEDLVVMEMSEYDHGIKDDVYYRSIHYIPHNSKEKKEKEGDKHISSWSSWWRRWTGEKADNTATTDHNNKNNSSSGLPSSSSSSSSSAIAPMDDPNDDYFKNMPGGGSEHIHGLVKCREVLPSSESGTTSTSTSSSSGDASPCIPYAGDLSREVSRKLLLALGPTEVMQDPAKSLMPMRFSRIKQPEVRTLVIGLRGGELPRWLSAAYPNFAIDVVEPDLSLIRVVKNFLGFQENSKLRLVAGTDGFSFAERKAAEVSTAHVANETLVQLRALFIPWKRSPTTHYTSGVKKGSHLPPEQDPRPYDLILMDGMNHRGELPAWFGRLDFIQHIRQILSPTGCVALAVPNRDAMLLYHMVQHWRMGFSGRSVVLMHCHREPLTVLMTFQDEGGRGEGKMGFLRNADEMKDLIRTHLTHYGLDRVPQFDLTREVDGGVRRDSSSDNNKNEKAAAKDMNGVPDSSGGFFQVLEPDRRYSMQDYLPPGHPLRQSSAAAMSAAASQKQEWWWQPFINRLVGNN